MHRGGACYAAWVRRMLTQERRAQLVSLGLRLFGDRAYEEVAIDDIASAAGVSKGLLYHYFKNKRGFYAACVDAAARLLLERLDGIDLRDPVQAVLDGLHRYLDFVEGYESVYRAMLTGSLGGHQTVQAVLEDARRSVTRLIQREIGLSVERPAFRNTVRGWIGAVEASAVDWLRHRDLPREAFATLHHHALATRIKDAARIDPEAPVDPAIWDAIAAMDD